MSPRGRRAALARLAAATAFGWMAAGAPALQAQVPPVTSSSTTTTTTTSVPPGSPTTAAPSGSDFSATADQAPAGAADAEGDGAAAPAEGIRVPPEAQRIIDAVRRSGPSSNAALLTAVAELQDLGVAEADALRVGLGRFPIAGPARYSHDWLFPRYGPGFRFHLGTDVFAAYGTPVRAPIDGVAHSASGGLGGLTVKVAMPDGTFFYLAHLSGLVEGFVDGMSVSTGDIVGYVGDSGNARGGAPHLHIGIYPHGGPPIDPKPILDWFLGEAEARVPELISAYEQVRPAPALPAAPVYDQRALRPMLATGLLHDLASGTRTWPAEVLYLTGADVVAGPHVLLDLALEDIVASLDWNARESNP